MQDPLDLLGNDLLEVQKPSRYIGKEARRLSGRSSLLRIALCFPDLYESGMCNQGIRILYEALNEIPGCSCELVFAPAPDFEKLLRTKGLRLFTLDSHQPVSDFDIIAFSVGYELALNGIFTVLDLSGIPVARKDRKETDPVIIAGGNGLSNPAPFAPFIDYFWIGEAEDGFFDLISDLVKSTPDKSSIRRLIGGHESVFVPDVAKRVRRAVYSSFSGSDSAAFGPLPNIRPIHSHGSVEIMRGCPNGCRFCQAGFVTRPYRLRNPRCIERAVDRLVREGGYSEITLSSLSSGDYPGILQTLDSLNRRYGDSSVSFQLPSLKVESFDQDIIPKLAEIRRSGLTLAIETPSEAGQMAINKVVPEPKLRSILESAERNGFKQVKCYFMIGLPGKASDDEIARFLLELSRGTRLEIVANINVFVPKPGTPFERAPQLGDAEAYSRILRLKEDVLHRRRIRIKHHDTFLSWIEGLVARGDERAGWIAHSAWNHGARLDTWDEFFDRAAWKAAIDEADFSSYSFVENGFDPSSALPWDAVSLGTSTRFLREEAERSAGGILTSSCGEGHCEHPCGARCEPERNLVFPLDSSADSRLDEDVMPVVSARVNAESIGGKAVFTFDKTGHARFVSHLDMVEMLARAFRIAGVPLAYTRGFNPGPDMELASPVSTGVESENDIGIIRLDDHASFSKLDLEKVNKCLREGIRLTAAAPLKRQSKISRCISGVSYVATFSSAGIAEAFIASLDKKTDASLDLQDGRKVRMRFSGPQAIGSRALFERAREADHEARLSRTGILYENGETVFSFLCRTDIP